MLDSRRGNAWQHMKTERNKSIEINPQRERRGRPTNPKGEAKRKSNPVVRGERTMPWEPWGANRKDEYDWKRGHQNLRRRTSGITIVQAKQWVLTKRKTCGIWIQYNTIQYILNWPLPIGAFQGQWNTTKRQNRTTTTVKNPNWLEANQLAIYKCGWEVEPGTTRIKFNEWSEVSGGKNIGVWKKATMIIRTLGKQIDHRRARKGIWGKERKGGTIQSTLQIRRRQSHQIREVARSAMATKFSLHLNPGRRGKLRILQGKNTGWGVRRIISRRNVKEIKMNVISGDNPKNPPKEISKIARFWALATPGRNENLAIGVDVHPTVTKRRRKGI